MTILQKLKNLENIIIFFLCVIFIGISIFGIKNLYFFPNNTQIPLIQKYILTFFMFLFFLFGLIGIFSFFLTSKEKILKRAFSLFLISFFILFPFFVIIEIWVSLIFYFISTIGIFLFQKYK